MGVSPLLIFTLLACASLGLGYVTMEQVAVRPGHENECWVSTKNQFFASGSSWPEDDVCEKGFCQGATLIERHGCGSVGAGPSCKLVTPDKSLNLTYPDCCPYPKCS
ncbi:U-scoloptoxin(16)-Er9a-like [Pollicipes pollicipes]|uniref:U-scoloptoxin(16)-Er9a-like n=1 Tax=Pollicipes pollicipes TaxID=41117 RepID=UPI001884BC3E|nr:U-scoloptoxin(16)-Er9a-like [Pollicipes pollicipes]